MKESIRTLAPEFSMRRMVKAYAKDLYFELMDQNNKAIQDRIYTSF